MISPNEHLILGILTEGPQHGYRIEQIINERGMRKWTDLGFSSIYYILEKLEKKGLVASKPSRGKEKKEYQISQLGLEELRKASLERLSQPKPTHSQLMTGLATSFLLDQKELLQTLSFRKKQLELDLLSMLEEEKQIPDQNPVTNKLFRLGQIMLEAELSWLDQEVKDLKGGSNDGL